MEDRQHCPRLVAGAGLVVALFVALLRPAAAQVPRGLIEQALDQPVKSLEIVDTPIRDALSRIEQKTGLHFTLANGVLELMPYGEQTLVTIRIRDMSVRAALRQVLQGLGLEMLVEPGQVVIAPGPILERLGRPLTIDEIRLLSRLAGESWSTLKRTEQPPALEFQIDPQQQPREALERALAQVDAPNALEQLESACRTLGWVWEPHGRRLVFRTMRDEILRRLDWPLDLVYQREPLDRLLVELGARVGVLIKFQPGALLKVRARDRAVDLIQRGGSVRQALERICGNTGLRYEIDDEGVHIFGPVEPEPGPQAATIERWVRIEVPVCPGVTMDVFMRQDQLPLHLRQQAQRKLEEILGDRVDR